MLQRCPPRRHLSIIFASNHFKSLQTTSNHLTPHLVTSLHFPRTALFYWPDNAHAHCSKSNSSSTSLLIGQMVYAASQLRAR